MTVTETQLVDRVIEWVHQNRASEPSEHIPITSDTDLLAAGLIDSLGFVDLISFIESHEGCRIDLTEADPSEFAVIRGLCRMALRKAQ